METIKKIAIYIDADNISYNNASKIIDILSQKGTLIIKSLIADWQKDTMSGWRKSAATHSMTPIQQFAYSGKNSNDFAMVIQAMKDLYEKPYIDIFCLVSTDRDFTCLAQEIKNMTRK